MLYLAQVQKQEFSGEVSLLLLSGKNSDGTWAMLSGATVAILPTNDVSDRPNLATNILATNILNEGVLVLAEVGENDQILHVQTATNWVLELVEKYLTTGFTPNFLQEEAQKAEEWRQSLALQSQELSRRSIEVEARREQIQNLEAKLQQEKQLLESTIAQFKTDN
ncbi:MAG: hypothetical protein HC849_31605 [Oscillatoriales cyanobacterium RU_3_3]|nr:hypothetical protein [Microcoleus sp. SU_5_6]NJL69273.1 hypothetical protein [Microcoleus sp. SM1_3_4]NJM63663.1 hypothetical protein [Oscillatoriales cyanobacterium RU_3_3]NJR20975.1 hypothetical protein [Richelia sp. CSU_2_1]